MEKVERGCEQQVEEARTHFMDQLAEERSERERLSQDLCKAHIEMEEMKKVSTTSVHMTVQYYQVLLLVAYHKPFE